MRISDWSSDVCSSDLFILANGVKELEQEALKAILSKYSLSPDDASVVEFLRNRTKVFLDIDAWGRDVSEVDMIRLAREKGLLTTPYVFCEDDASAMAEAGAATIGRASCRERVCQYVSISVVAGSLQKKHNKRYSAQ